MWKIWRKNSDKIRHAKAERQLHPKNPPKPSKNFTPTTIDLWLISLTASKELSILLLKLLEC